MTGLAMPKGISPWGLLRKAGFALWLLAILIVVAPNQLAQAQTYTVLHSFGSGTDGATPLGGLAIYNETDCCLGTTAEGGEYGYGTVFKVRYYDGAWTYTLVHSFTGADGAYPQDSPIDSYGTTPNGTDGIGGTLYGVDTLNNSIITDYSFCGLPDCSSLGENAFASPTIYGTAKGSLLYGTMNAGGSDDAGVLYYIDLSSGEETVVYNFGASNGSQPLYSRLTESPVTLNSPIFYGTASYGGSYPATGGVVFQLDVSTGAVTILHTFLGTPPDGATPRYGVVADTSGNIYGTTSAGGTYGHGTIFKISASGEESILYSFSGGSDGADPYGNLALDNADDLYGTTTDGGSAGYGTLFELSASGTFSVLHTFCSSSSCSDGANPMGASLESGSAVYGTTQNGGDYGMGVAYQFALP
jgi:uncharacterized repeat protein (TIGR03803 family)